MVQLALQLSLQTPGATRGGAAPVAAIVISASTTPENSTAGTTVGTLSTVLTTGTAVFSLVDNAGSRFALSGTIIQRGATALDYETSTYHNIVVGVTGVTPTIANTTLTINVTNIAEIPAITTPPTLSPTTGAVGTLITCGTGSWTNTPTSYAYQWMRTGVDISGATSSTYTSVLADDTLVLTCKVLASNADGPASGYSTTSNSHTAGASVALILDSYTVGIAYSLRKLRTAYAGNCIRIRRSSDNAEQNIGFVGNVVDAASIASFIGGGSGFIATWYDQSGNTLDLTQATAGSQMLYVASGINSKPGLRTTTDKALTRALVPAATITNLTEQTMMHVLLDRTGSGQSKIFGDSTPYFRILQLSGTAYYDFGIDPGGRSSVSLGGSYFDNAKVWEVYRTTAGSQAIINNGTTLVSEASKTSNMSAINVNLTVDANNGDFYEVFILKTDVGSTARGTIRADMGSYYGITVA